MATYAYIGTELAASPRIRMLIEELGQQAAWGYVCLLLCASENGWGASLDVMVDADIERAAGWSGRQGTFVPTLLALGLIRGARGTYVLQDWASPMWSVP